MNHPGPPRFCAVGDTIELAPRDPDPEADAIREWTVLERPAESTLSASTDPVLRVAPDAPGVYRFELEASDERFEQRVRAFPEPRRSTTFEIDRDELPDHDPEGVSVIGPFDEHLVGRERPTLEDGTYRYGIELPPGDHRYAYLVNEDLENAVWNETTVSGPGRPRLRLDAERGDETFADAKCADDSHEETIAIRADTWPGTDSEYAADELAVEFYVDDRDARSTAGGTLGSAVESPESILDIEGDEARLSPADVDDRIRIHAVAVGERHSVADRVDVYADGRVERPNDPPEWARNAVVYEIFVRSFTDAGTFESLERRVPYLESLGIDCLWLTPILESPTDHGYHTTDYFDTASDLGAREEFESFVDRCHEGGIRVVFDLVVNHTGRDHPAFDMSAAGVPAYEDWYVWETLEASGVDPYEFDTGRDADGPPRRTLANGDLELAQYYFDWRGIPNLNFDSLAVRQFVLSVVDEWVDVVDGYRCDVAWGVPHGFWKEVHDRVKSRDREFLLLDETIPRDPDYGECEFDVHYDTTLYGTLRDIGNGEASAAALLDAATAPEREGFPDSSLQMRYVENHDEPRYVDDCGRDALRAAAGAVLTLPGVPMIYYGQERGATGYRQTMPWEGDGELAAFHRRLVDARRDSPVLARGALVELEYESDTAAAVAYGRRIEDERAETERAEDEAVVVALNFGSDPARISLPFEVGGTDLVSGESIPTIDRDGETAAHDGETGSNDGGTTLSVDDVVVRRIDSLERE